MAMRIKFLIGANAGRILYADMDGDGNYHMLQDPDIPGEKIIPGNEGLPLLDPAEDLRLVTDTDGEVCIQQKYDGVWSIPSAMPISDPDPRWPIEKVTIPSVKEQAEQLLELGRRL